MLHSLELENFKAFGRRARIPFAPITLIFGENSAGKSTILQALNLLKQTLESREPAGVPLLLQNGIVDLGSFQEMLFDHDLNRTFSIRVGIVTEESDMGSPPVSVSELPPIFKRDLISIELNFSRPSLEESVRLDQIGIYDGESSKCISKFKPLGKSVSTSMSFDSYSPVLPLTLAECIWLTQEPEYWEPLFKYCKEKQESMLQVLQYRVQNLLKDNSEKDPFFIGDSLDSLNNLIELFSSDFDLETFTSKRHKEEINSLLGVLIFVPVSPQSNYTGPQSGISDANQLAIIAGKGLKRALEQLFPISPIRKLPERSYIFSGTDPDNVGYRGDSLPDILFRNSELVEDTNKWLKRLGIDYELEVNSIRAHSDDFYSDDFFQVRLIDTRRKKRVNVALPDVGFGVSQLLPFIVQSLVPEKQIISIEQPEVHIHPRLQADLGELLAEAIKSEKQFIIETHSEHLILRLQRLVYKGKIKPEDVSVIYVSRGPEGAKAERLRLDEEGDFIDEWPNGFFLERLRELR